MPCAVPTKEEASSLPSVISKLRIRKQQGQWTHSGFVKLVIKGVVDTMLGSRKDLERVSQVDRTEEGVHKEELIPRAGEGGKRRARCCPEGWSLGTWEVRSCLHCRPKSQHPAPSQDVGFRLQTFPEAYV